jgi:SAM-dependent methyltransferase
LSHVSPVEGENMVWLPAILQAFKAENGPRAARWLMARISELHPASWREHRERVQVGREFDRRHGVDTGGYFRPPTPDAQPPGWLDARRYEGILPEPFRQVVGALPIHFPDFTFIDLGSGKGRALLLASELPFRQVIGVEHSPDLHGIAEQNLHIAHGLERRCCDVRPTCQDVCDFILPPVPTVLYLYNPFGPRVMQQVVARVGESLAAAPRGMYVVYFVPACDQLWRDARFLHPVVLDSFYSVYSARSLASTRGLAAA